MSPRADGMPEGHPEKRPVKLATLTLYGAGDPEEDSMTWGELKIVGAYPRDQVDDVVQKVRALLRQVLAEDPTVFEAECQCGGHHAKGGDQS